MKAILVIWCLVLAPLSARAMEFEVVGKRGERLLATTPAPALPASVGAITVGELTASGIAFGGGDFGISEMFGLGQDIDVISDTEMKAYGWCFSVDGVVAETMPDKTTVTLPDSRLRWFYAYAHYLNGDWIAQCVPADQAD